MLRRLENVRDGEKDVVNRGGVVFSPTPKGVLRRIYRGSISDQVFIAHALR